MLLQQFLLENLRFAINLGAALVFFAAFWLYFDSWLDKKALKEFFRFIGFILLALSYVAASTMVESTLIEFPQAFASIRSNIEFVLTATRIGGYTLIVVSLILDPIIPRPTEVSKFKKLGVVLPVLPAVDDGMKSLALDQNAIPWHA